MDCFFGQHLTKQPLIYDGWAFKTLYLVPIARTRWQSLVTGPSAVPDLLAARELPILMREMHC